MKLKFTWLAAGLFAAAATLISGSAAAECPAGKIEVTRITKSGQAHTKCVSENAAEGMETAGDNAAGAFVTASFTPLGDLLGGGFNSSAFGISADGSTVVGQSVSELSSSGDGEAMYWTEAGGMVGLYSQFGDSSWAYGVSADGSFVVGLGSSVYGRGAFRLTKADGAVVWLTYPLGSSEAADVSAGGSVVVGSFVSSDGTEAFRWTEADGAVGLGDLPGGAFRSVARGVSADGSVVVGTSAIADFYIQAFRWSLAARKMVGLDPLPGGLGSSANGVSADGSFVVGGAYSNGDYAVRWMGTDAPEALWCCGSRATDASRDGSVVVGSRWNEGVRWTEVDGAQTVQSLLEAQGVDLTGWFLGTAQAVSDDGTSIVGFGSNPNGDGEAWLATLPLP
jgi:probable HAF family extracellular repeat protein